MVCRPSDQTVGRPVPCPRFEPETGGLEAGTLTNRPPCHAFAIHAFKTGYSAKTNLSAKLILACLSGAQVGYFHRKKCQYISWHSHFNENKKHNQLSANSYFSNDRREQRITFVSYSADLSKRRKFIFPFCKSYSKSNNNLLDPFILANSYREQE